MLHSRPSHIHGGLGRGYKHEDEPRHSTIRKYSWTIESLTGIYPPFTAFYEAHTHAICISSVFTLSFGRHAHSLLFPHSSRRMNRCSVAAVLLHAYTRPMHCIVAGFPPSHLATTSGMERGFFCIPNCNQTRHCDILILCLCVKIGRAHV